MSRTNHRRIVLVVVVVSAVPAHRQTILIGLITDVERRVLRPVPQTGIALNLCVTHVIDNGMWRKILCKATSKLDG